MLSAPQTSIHLEEWQRVKVKSEVTAGGGLSFHLRFPSPELQNKKCKRVIL